MILEKINLVVIIRHLFTSYVDHFRSNLYIYLFFSPNDFESYLEIIEKLILDLD